MDIAENKNTRLKNFVKEQMRQNLLKCGRQMVVEQGPDFLTARKLADVSGASVGTIYNLFATMDDFIRAENLQRVPPVFRRQRFIKPFQRRLGQKAGGIVVLHDQNGCHISHLFALLRLLYSAKVKSS